MGEEGLAIEDGAPVSSLRRSISISLQINGCVPPLQLT